MAPVIIKGETYYWGVIQYKDESENLTILYTRIVCIDEETAAYAINANLSDGSAWETEDIAQRTTHVARAYVQDRLTTQISRMNIETGQSEIRSDMVGKSFENNPTGNWILGHFDFDTHVYVAD